MKHTYLIEVSQRDATQHLVDSVLAFTNGKAEMFEMIRVETEDERLAQILDQILGANGRTAVEPKKGAQARTKTYQIQTCRHCKKTFRPIGQEKICPDCKAGTASEMWLVISTGEQINHTALTQQLSERTIPIGTVVNHPKNGTFSVVMKNNQYFLEKCQVD